MGCNSDTCLACALNAGTNGYQNAASRYFRCDIDRMAAVPRAVRLAVAIIKQTYAENVPLGRLAKTVACSPWQLSRVFHASTGVTLTQYRTQVRLARAIWRLRAGEESLARLAVDLGFAHHSHFTASFVRLMGAQPTIFRTMTRFRQRETGAMHTVYGTE